MVATYSIYGVCIMKSFAGRNCRAGLLPAAIVIAALLPLLGRAETAAPTKATLDTFWTVPEVGALPDDTYGRLVRQGRDLITATWPEVGDPAKRYAGNNLACGNCHLEAGTKRFGLAIFGLYNTFPRYSAREGAEITVEQRVNSCMTRSMNGRAIPDDAPEMKAFVAYIKFLSSGVPPDQRIPGLGAGKIPELDRAADPGRGRNVYAAQCAGCRHEPAHHRGELRSLQHAARR
jgi:thiosulfate dehydrogenase